MGSVSFLLGSEVFFKFAAGRKRQKVAPGAMCSSFKARWEKTAKISCSLQEGARPQGIRRLLWYILAKPHTEPMGLVCIFTYIKTHKKSSKCR